MYSAYFLLYDTDSGYNDSSFSLRSNTNVSNIETLRDKIVNFNISILASRRNTFGMANHFRLIYVIGSEKTTLMAPKKFILLRRAKVTSALAILQFVSGA